jgi:hypothetical protein
MFMFQFKEDGTGALEVRLGDKLFGIIDETSFWVSPTMIDGLVRLSPLQLRQLAARTETHLAATRNMLVKAT